MIEEFLNMNDMKIEKRNFFDIAEEISKEKWYTGEKLGKDPTFQEAEIGYMLKLEKEYSNDPRYLEEWVKTSGKTYREIYNYLVKKYK